MTELTTYYQNVKRAVRQNLTLYFAAIIVLMMLTSVLLGPPFSRTVTTAGFTYRVDGWFWEKNWLMYLIILVSGLLAVIRGGAAGVKNFKALRNILYMDCDAERLLCIADEGTRYVPYDVYRNQKQARKVAGRQRRYFEQLYVEALLACGQVGVADLYMKNGWKSKRNTLIYRAAFPEYPGPLRLSGTGRGALPQHYGTGRSAAEAEHGALGPAGLAGGPTGTGRGTAQDYAAPGAL